MVKLGVTAMLTIRKMLALFLICQLNEALGGLWRLLSCDKRIILFEGRVTVWISDIVWLDNTQTPLWLLRWLSDWGQCLQLSERSYRRIISYLCLCTEDWLCVWQCTSLCLYSYLNISWLLIKLWYTNSLFLKLLLLDIAPTLTAIIGQALTLHRLDTSHGLLLVRWRNVWLRQQLWKSLTHFWWGQRVRIAVRNGWVSHQDHLCMMPLVVLLLASIISIHFESNDRTVRLELYGAIKWHIIHMIEHFRSLAYL